MLKTRVMTRGSFTISWCQRRWLKTLHVASGHSLHNRPKRILNMSMALIEDLGGRSA